MTDEQRERDSTRGEVIPTPFVQVPGDSPLSFVSQPMVNVRTDKLLPYMRRDPGSYSDSEKEQIFFALAHEVTRMVEQRRESRAIDLIVLAAAVSPTTSASEVEALALWQRWSHRDRTRSRANQLDPDINKRYWHLKACFDPELSKPRDLSAIDGIRAYWDFPERYLHLLEKGTSPEHRVQQLTNELSTARKTAAELSRQAIELLAEATKLDNAIADVPDDDSPTIAMAQAQVADMRAEASRLTTAGQDYRERAETLLRTLSAIKPGYENYDGEPTARVVLALGLQRQVHDRDGGRCVKCGSTFKLQIDHVVPLSLGGSNEVSNLQVLCMACNTAKGNRYIG